MIVINNPILFGFEYSISDDLVLVNITVDPEIVELKNYKRTPFSTLLFKSKTLAENFMNLSELDIDTKTRKKEILELISPLLNSCSMEMYNLFLDNEYDMYKEIFSNNVLHTIILFIDDSKPKHKTDKVIMIGGYPVRGMISPMTKSQDYLLFNGSFISTKMFSMKEDMVENNNDFIYYDKIVYVLVEIKTQFEFREYIPLHDSIGLCYNHRFMIGIDDDKSIKVDSELECRKIPIAGREYLFQKPEKNIFHLSDVPKDIMMRNSNIIKKI